MFTPENTRVVMIFTKPSKNKVHTYNIAVDGPGETSLNFGLSERVRLVPLLLQGAELANARGAILEVANSPPCPPHMRSGGLRQLTRTPLHSLHGTRHTSSTYVRGRGRGFKYCTWAIMYGIPLKQPSSSTTHPGT